MIFIRPPVYKFKTLAVLSSFLMRLRHKLRLNFMEIERLCFGQQWCRTQFVSALKELCLVYDKDGILGFLIACTCDIARRAIIMRIAVHPQHQGQE